MAIPAWGETLLGFAGPAAVLALAAVIGLDLAGSHVFGTPSAAFDLDAEHNVPSAFSAGLFAIAALAAAGLRRATPAGAPGRTAALALAVLLGWMAIDDLAMLHERMVGLIDAVHWIVWYLPVVGATIYAAVRVSRAHPEARGPFLFTFGAWFLSGFIEMASWDEVRHMQPWGWVLIEETLEMLAALALILGLVRALRRAAATPSSAFLLSDGGGSAARPPDGPPQQLAP